MVRMSPDRRQSAGLGNLDKHIGLVLPGGGARGAYQVGVLKAVARLLPRRTCNPFSVLSGTSAGAISAAVLASGARSFRTSVTDLERVWANFHSSQVFRCDSATMLKSSLHWLAAVVLGGLGPRNPKAFLLAIVGAEYVLRLLPRGTHEYEKLIKPSELARFCRDAGLEVGHRGLLQLEPTQGGSGAASNRRGCRHGGRRVFRTPDASRRRRPQHRGVTQKGPAVDGVAAVGHRYLRVVVL